MFELLEFALFSICIIVICAEDFFSALRAFSSFLFCVLRQHLDTVAFVMRDVILFEIVHGIRQ